MDYVIFSINIVFPIFIIIFMGFVLKRKGLITDDFITSSSSVIYYLALPTKLFYDVAKSDFYSLINIKFIVYIVGITIVSFSLIWFLADKLMKDKSKVSAFIHGAYRGNYVYIGLPITKIILDKEIIPSTILVVAFVLPLYNILAVTLFCYYNGQKRDIRSLLLRIIKDPMVLAVAAALPFSLLKIELPFAITKSMDYIGSLATPMALLLIGAGIQWNSFLKNIRYIINASIFKVIIQPLIFVSLAIYLRFSSEEIVTIYVLMAAPTAMNAYIVTKKFGGDDLLAAGIILATVMLSAIILPIGAIILRLLQIIN